VLTANVQVLNPVKGTATLQVVNTSSQPITGFTIALEAVYTDGNIDRSQHTEDYGPLVAPLAPSHTAEEPLQFGPYTNNSLLRVDAKVLVVIYADQTADVLDEDGHSARRRNQFPAWRAPTPQNSTVLQTGLR
jgi:hypothetical protein